jgi:hypothetical protein
LPKNSYSPHRHVFLSTINKGQREYLIKITNCTAHPIPTYLATNQTQYNNPDLPTTRIQTRANQTHQTQYNNPISQPREPKPERTKLSTIILYLPTTRTQTRANQNSSSLSKTSAIELKYPRSGCGATWNREKTARAPDMQRKLLDRGDGCVDQGGGGTREADLAAYSGRRGAADLTWPRGSRIGLLRRRGRP